MLVLNIVSDIGKEKANLREKSLQILLKFQQNLPIGLKPMHMPSFKAAMIRALFLFIETDTYDPKWKESILEAFTQLGVRSSAERMIDYAQRKMRPEDQRDSKKMKTASSANFPPTGAALPQPAMDINPLLRVLKLLPLEVQILMILQNMANLPTNIVPVPMDPVTLQQFIATYGNDPVFIPPETPQQDKEVRSKANTNVVEQPLANVSALVVPKLTSEQAQEIYIETFNRVIEEKELIEVNQFGEYLRGVVLCQLSSNVAVKKQLSNLLLEQIRKDIPRNLPLALFWLYQLFSQVNLQSYVKKEEEDSSENILVYPFSPLFFRKRKITKSKTHTK